MTLGGTGRQFVGERNKRQRTFTRNVNIYSCALGIWEGIVAKWGLHLQLSSGSWGPGDVSQRETAEIIL